MKQVQEIISKKKQVQETITIFNCVYIQVFLF